MFEQNGKATVWCKFPSFFPSSFFHLLPLLNIFLNPSAYRSGPPYLSPPLLKAGITAFLNTNTAATISKKKKKGGQRWYGYNKLMYLLKNMGRWKGGHSITLPPKFGYNGKTGCTDRDEMTAIKFYLWQTFKNLFTLFLFNFTFQVWVRELIFFHIKMLFIHNGCENWAFGDLQLLL